MNTHSHTPGEDPLQDNSVRKFNYNGRVVQAHVVDFAEQFRDILNPKESLYGETE